MSKDNIEFLDHLVTFLRIYGIVAFVVWVLCRIANVVEWYRDRQDDKRRRAERKARLADAMKRDF